MDQRRSDVTTLSRKDLHERMWKTPGSTLAKEFGISDVGLAKICDRHDIPRPPRGYWAKLAYGKAEERPSLPEIVRDELEEVRIFRQSFLEADESDVAPAKASKVIVPEALVSPHPLIAATRKYLRAVKKGADGILKPDLQNCLDIRVAQSSLARALLVFDAFIKEWERLGGTISVGKVDHNRKLTTSVELHGSSVPVELFEETKRFEINSDANRRWGYKDWRREPVGQLVFHVDYVSWDAHRTRWADGKKKQRLEDLVGSIVQGLIEILDLVRLRRLDEECEARQKQELEQVREAARRRSDDEEKRRKDLIASVASWKEATEIRAYLAELRRKLDSGQLKPKNAEAFAEWLEWADWFADHLDPLTLAPARAEFTPSPKNTPLHRLDLTRNTKSVIAQLGVTDSDELSKVERNQLPGEWNWKVWDEIGRILELLDYPLRKRR